jgi:hypothetical protein
MTDSDQVLFMVKSNDGVTVRLSSVERLVKDSDSFEVVICGLPPVQINQPCLTVGGLIFWSPSKPECQEAIPKNDEPWQELELVRKRLATRPDVVDNEGVIFALWTPNGCVIRTMREYLASSVQSVRVPRKRRLSLEMIQDWVETVFRERRLSPEELAELGRRTDAACEKYGWPDLGKQYDVVGEQEQTRNIAYIMLNREMPFRAAAFEYLAALEKGSRKLAADAELDSAASSLLTAMANIDPADLVGNGINTRSEA